mmetsp:Transcript_40637/g.66789  ORF Transcript_40637/g.66789 Transcript_40637/m.66789 type:complete len:219 (-) Transcript_40637:2298-2954(-)
MFANVLDLFFIVCNVLLTLGHKLSQLLQFQIDPFQITTLHHRAGVLAVHMLHVVLLLFELGVFYTIQHTHTLKPFLEQRLFLQRLVRVHLLQHIMLHGQQRQLFLLQTLAFVFNVLLLHQQLLFEHFQLFAFAHQLQLSHMILLLHLFRIRLHLGDRLRLLIHSATQTRYVLHSSLKIATLHAQLMALLFQRRFGRVHILVLNLKLFLSLDKRCLSLV